MRKQEQSQGERREQICVQQICLACCSHGLIGSQAESSNNYPKIKYGLPKLHDLLSVGLGLLEIHNVHLISFL